MSSTAGADTVFQPLEADDPAAVGSYRLAARLGSGGMGKVYLSYTPAGRPVAIKVIRPEFAEDPEFRRRFRQEVAAAQRVHGLHTAPVIDSDADGSQPWLATAFVSGPTVAAAVAEHGPLPVPTVLLLVAGIAEALQAVHAAGIVHRDLKPSNVLLAADGPRVIDFGIARAADATSLTDSGITIGTPAFMSPEQAAGRTITDATDVFALGQVAAYAALGGPAYGEGPSHAVLYRIVHEEPDLSALPAELRPLVTRCLAKEPDRRPSLAEVVSLCQAASDQTQLVRPEQWLPVAVAAAIPERHAAPTYNPQASNGASGTPAVPATTPDRPAVAPPPSYTPTARSTQPPPAHPPTQPAAVRQPPVQQPHVQQAPAPQPQAAQQPATQAAFHQTPPPQGYAQGPARPGYQQPHYGYPQQQHPGPQRPYGPMAGRPAPLPLPPKKRNKGLIVLAIVGALVVLGLISSAVRGLTNNSDDHNTDASTGTTSGTTGSNDKGSTGGSTGTPSHKPAPPKAASFPGIQLASGFHLEFADEALQPRQGLDDDFFYYCSGGSDCHFASEATKLVLLTADEKGSLDTCLKDTRYTTQIERARLSAGSQICARTDAGAVVLITYRRASSDADPSVNAVIDVQVWRNAIPPENT
jgi:serine/threonine protein kinase